MPRDANIFSNIIGDENSLTELFCNLLQFTPFKTLFTRLLEEKLKLKDIDFHYDQIETQNSLGQEGIPDISIKNDGLSLLIECKIEAGTTLTSNQPLSYLNSLKGNSSGKTRALVFLLPNDYVYEKELLSRQQRFFERNKNRRVGFAILYWQEILEGLQRTGIAELSPLFQHFSSLLRDWFSTLNINFSEEEMIMLYNKEIPALYLKLTGVVEEVRNKLSKSYKLGREINEYGNGFYIKDAKGKPILWFGVWYNFWQQKGYPLVFGVWDEFGNRVVKKFRTKFKEKVILFDEDTWYLHGLPEELIIDPNNIKRIITLLTQTVEFVKK